MSARVQAVGALVEECAHAIAAQFKPGAKVTIVVRTPTHPDGSRDMVVTSDDIDAVIGALRTRAEAERAAGAAA